MELPIVGPGVPTSANDILSLTEPAAGKVKELLAQRGTPDQALRLGVRGGGCSGNSYFMEYCEAPEDGDVVLESHGVRLVVDRRSAMALHGTTIEWVSGLMGSGFKFINPNARHSCACGESFSV